MQLNYVKTLPSGPGKMLGNPFPSGLMQGKPGCSVSENAEPLSGSRVVQNITEHHRRQSKKSTESPRTLVLTNRNLSIL